MGVLLLLVVVVAVVVMAVLVVVVVGMLVVLVVVVMVVVVTVVVMMVAMARPVAAQGVEGWDMLKWTTPYGGTVKVRCYADTSGAGKSEVRHRPPVHIKQ